MLSVVITASSGQKLERQQVLIEARWGGNPAAPMFSQREPEEVEVNNRYVFFLCCF